VIVVTDEHMTVTASRCVKEDSKTVLRSIIVTADCYARRDRAGLLGIITSVDLRVDGKTCNEANVDDFGEQLKQFQKALTENMLGLTYRVRSGVLLVSDLQVATPDDAMKKKVDDLASCFCGQYQLVTGPLPKQKPVEVVSWVAGMTLPSPRYLERTPQYSPGDPAFPLPRELANPIEPAPAPREKVPGGGTVIPPMLPPEPLPMLPPTR
jgi:hypothetical protein